ncbi:MAG: septum formation initiator family protein [Bacteroidales bacterium]|nr:septum formation initiator family protein [Bacteroidales bacterium]
MEEQENNIISRLNEIRDFFTQKRIIIIIVSIFCIWLIFFDQNSMLHRYEAKKEQKKLMDTKKELQEKIKETNEELKSLDSDEYIERVAREKHWMKKSNEDIYIITE